MAFDLSDNIRKGKILRAHTPQLTGDIIISTDAAINNSKIYNTSIHKEISLYIIHGILHLLGYDDQNNIDVQKMRDKEQKLLEYLGNRVNNVIK